MTIDYAELNRLIPLDDGCHSDVVRLEINIPFRFAECHFLLRDGTRTGLRNRRQLLGWTMGSARREYYFEANEQLVRLRTNTARQQQLRDVALYDGFAACRALSDADRRVTDLGRTVHKVVAPDGHLLFIAPELARVSDSAAELLNTTLTAPATAPALAT